MQAEYAAVLEALRLSARHASAHNGAHLPTGTRRSSRRCTFTICHEKVCSRRRSCRAACQVLTTAPSRRPTGLLAAALPLPAASSTGRDRLSSAFDAWSLVLRQRPGDAHASAQRAPLACVSRMQVLTTAPVFPPGDAHASVRLALVEAELAFQSSTAGANDAEARRHLRSALDRMEKVIATDDR